MATDLTGTNLGPFQIETLIGQGAMGSVYRARHSKTGRAAAIKVMLEPKEQTAATHAARFEREIKLLSQFHHPNIVRIYGASVENGVRYYAMELVEGKSLEQILDEQKKLSFSRAIHFTVQICEALQEMHSCGVIHRDLKPANLIVSSDRKVKLTDFGIAKDTSAFHTQQLTQADHTVGTVAYMSPEQLAGKDLTRRSDIYSLGIVLYQMLTGRLPFKGDTVFEYINQRMAGAFPLPSKVNPEVPVEFDELLRSMLQQDPEDRPRDAYVVMQKLLDISKKAKEGTLTKTRPEDSVPDGLAETVVLKTDNGMGSTFGTMLKTIGTKFTLGGKKKRWRSDTPFLESPAFLVLCLIAVLGFVVYMLWPLGPDELFARGADLMASDQYADWLRAEQKYFKPLLEKYPDSPHRHVIREYTDRIRLSEADGKMRRAMQITRLPESATEGFRKCYEAMMIAEVLGDEVTAQERFRAVASVFENQEHERMWVLFAQNKLLHQLEFKTDEARIEAKRTAVGKAIARADSLAEKGRLGQAAQVYGSIVELYGDDKEVADLLSDARNKLLGGAKPPEKS